MARTSPERMSARVAFGLKAHSGWAALVVVGSRDGQLTVADRRRIELVERGDESWAKQPYHAAEPLERPAAREMVQRGLESARRHALQQMQDAITRAEHDGYTVDGCAVLMGQPMPEWTVDEILAVHFRMHKAEGVLFRDALARAAKACQQRLVEIPERELQDCAAQVLRTTVATLTKRIDALGKSVGPPWGKDQKEAALAAMVALGRV
jgi:hypothetical protein